MWEHFGREQKAAFGLLIMLGVSGLVLGLFYFKTNLSIASRNLAERAAAKNQNQKNTKTVFDLAKEDTDKDGITDYDELYAYNTSPYLDDTDSDGLKDKEEIEKGKDPNCPEGNECYSDITGKKSAINLEAPTNTPPEIINPLDAVKNMSIADLRNLLRQSGMGGEVLSQISDEELKKLYDETIKDAEDSGELDKMVEEFNKENGGIIPQ